MSKTLLKIPRSCHRASFHHQTTSFPRIMTTINKHNLHQRLAIPTSEDEPEIRKKYRPFLLSEEVTDNDWISKLELDTVSSIAETDLLATGERIKILVLYGSLRERSYSKLLAYEASRILHRLGCDVRVYDPRGLPVKDDTQQDDPKVQELRELSRWSDGHFWCSPEQHGNLTAVFKNQIDWIPLSTGSVRPTQGRTLALAQVSGGSQSFNTVNSLRILGRWMRMFVIPNQSSVPMAYTQFTDAQAEEGGSRMVKCGNRDRLVDVVEEMVKVTVVVRGCFGVLGDRFSEREEKRVKERRVEEARMAKEEEEKAKAKEEGKAGDVVNGVNGVDGGKM